MNRWATEGETKQWLEGLELCPDAIRTLGATGLSVSSVGFGCYRVDTRPLHRDAMLHAVVNGCNLIDTSTNYMLGASERCVGEVVRLAESQGIPREALVLVTKAGYVQGPNLEMARAAEAQGRAFPDMVKYDEHCWHCIHPEYLRVQVEMARERMSVATPDVFLLHNPEYFFMAHSPNADVRDLRLIFYERIRSAFSFFEEAVQEGLIRFYGVSSNTFAHAPEHPHAVNVLKLLEIAEKVGGSEHHFRVAQLPFNLFEHAAATRPLAEGRTFLDLARSANLGVLVNRPLNAIRGQNLVRLADVPQPNQGMSFAIELKELVALEEEFEQKVSRQFSAAQLQGKALFVWGRELARLDPARIEVSEIERIEQSFVRPQVRDLFQWIESQLAGEDEGTAWALWRHRYWPKILQTMQVARLEQQRTRFAEAQKVRALLYPLLPPGWEEESLSRLACALVAATPGVSTVLVGMRSKAYVEDILPILKRARPDVASEIFGRLDAFR